MFSSRDSDILVSIKKACSSEESAPKRKHVRACIVYTWDHKSSRNFWNDLKVTPLQTNEVQMFKGLILIHKVLQEGHPSCLIGGFKQRDYIESLGRSFDSHSGIGRLIKEYSNYLIKKLVFHHDHRGFNGMFEYEEYISLRTVNDPNEGYDAIVSLLELQESLDELQRFIFSSLNKFQSNEFIISSLVPLVNESYGIHKFLISMLRAMYRSAENEEVLQPLRDSFNLQHRKLYEFYADCSSIRYLTTLITIPRLPREAPNLLIDDSDDATAAPQPIPSTSSSSQQQSVQSTPEPLSRQQTSSYNNNYIDQQRQFELQQSQIEQERQNQLMAQQQQQLQQQQYFEEQQKQQEEVQRLAQQQLMMDQMQRQSQGKVAELERDLLTLRGQYDRDQLMLEQYDQRVKLLENELFSLQNSAQQQMNSKDEQLNNLQEQILFWKNKYESLAKLYSQLRQEHLSLLTKFKKIQQRANSAQEAIDRREKLEKDMKSKNIELADLIRERDRALLELDRLKKGKSKESETLDLTIKELQDELATLQKSQSDNLATIFKQHNKEIDDLTSKLKNSSIDSDLKLKLDEKEAELEMMNQTMEETIRELSSQQKLNDEAMDEQIDAVLQEHHSKLSNLIDAILLNGINTIQDSLFELDSPMQAGNQLSTPEYLSTIIEKASNLATEFATSFNNFLIDGPNGDQTSIINTISSFTSSISEVLLNTKGVTRLSDSNDFNDDLLDTSRDVAEISKVFLEGLISSNLSRLPDLDSKTDKVISGNLNVQEILQTLSQFVDTLAPRSNGNAIKINSGDISDLVDSEMSLASKAIDTAFEHLNQLLNKPMDPSLSSIDIEINKSILNASIAVTNAIRALIIASKESQQEIVNKGRGSNSRTSFYKKHNKWTEGLISAAKSVAFATNRLIKIADGVLDSKNTHEELIVASNEVAAATAQLVAASRVKADFMSKTQDKLENASKEVSSACKSLVNQVQNILSSKNNNDGLNGVDYSKLSSYENKTAEMEQQVEILKLENALMMARKRLGEIRKFSYRDDEDDE